MVTRILDSLGQIDSELDDLMSEVEDLSPSEQRDKVLGILDVMKEDLTEARKEMTDLE